jgi:hypothetical protein
MTKLLSITANPDASVACDMTAAADTLAERMAEYRRLFDHALLGRESTDSSTTFRLADRPGVQEWLLDLVRREAACCPFLSYEVDTQCDPAGEQIVWTTGGLGASDMAALDEFLAGPGQQGETSASLAQQLTERGGVPILVPGADR